MQNPDICRALAVTCPYVSSARFDPNLVPGAMYAWASSRGRYEDGVMFFSDGPGMKIVAVEFVHHAETRWDENWYFQPGDCIKD